MKYTENYFSQWVGKWENPEERNLFEENDFFCSNLFEGTNIIENNFATHNEPPTAKLNFSGLLKLFQGKWQKKSL